MKKAMSLLLTLVMCLSLCACGGGNDTPETTEIPTTTIPATTELEISEPETTAPIEAEPQYETVEITMENWEDYFEFTHFYIPYKNSFGEVENFSVETRFCLKDGYNASNVDIAIEYSYVEQGFTYEVNFENGTLTFGKAVDSWGLTKDTTDMAITAFPCHLPSVGGRDETSVVIRTNYEMLRIQGTISVASFESSNSKEVFEGEQVMDLPTAEDPDLMYVPYIGKWVASNGDTVIINEDGTLIFNDSEYAPEYFMASGGIAVALQSIGEYFVWGLDGFGEDVMYSANGGRLFTLQVE